MLSVHPHDLRPDMVNTALYTLGLGGLPYCTEAKVYRKINGDHCLKITYPKDQPGAELLIPDRLIACEGQFYRISRVQPEDGRRGRFVRIEAPHIAYDLSGYNVVNIETKEDDRYIDGITARQALEQLLENTPFSVGTVDVDLAVLDYLEVLQISPLKAIKERLLKLWGGELVFDNFVIHLRAQMGKDRRYPIRARRNISEISFVEDIDEVITRLHVRGYQNANFEDINDGKDYIDSQFISHYSHVKEGYVDFDDIDDAEELLKLGREHLKKVEIPKVTYTVNLVPLESSLQYQVYKPLEVFELGDTAALHHDYLNTDILVRAVDIERDVLRGCNSRVTLGNPNEDIITAIMAGKTAADTVASIVSADGYLRAEKLAGPLDLVRVTNLVAEIARVAQIYIDKATITTAQIQDLQVEVAKILVASIQTADIDWAEIDILKTYIATLVTTQIGTANIDFAKITDMVTGTAIFEKLISGKLVVKDLVVTDANIVSLTAGKIVVKNDDGKYYRLTVGEDGTVEAVPELVEGGNIAEGTVTGTHLIENAITTRELNAGQIFADEALMGSMFAGIGKFGEMFAESAIMPYIRASVIESDALSIKVSNAAKEAVGYRVQIMATSGILSSDIKETTLTARVYQGKEDVTDEIDASRFHWRRVTADETADRLWAEAHKGLKGFTLTTLDVWYSATYICDIVE